MELNKMGAVPQHLFKVIRTPNRPDAYISKLTYRNWRKKISNYK